MFSIRQDVFTRRVVFDSVLPLFRNTSSNSFVFHFLLSLFNMIFRISLKGALSKRVWSHVFFAAFICILLLKSWKQFLWYLTLYNFNSMLLSFPLLAFFCQPSPFPLSSLPPFLPSLPRSPGFYWWDPPRWSASYSVMYPHQSMFSIRQDVFIRRALIDLVPLVFLCIK